MIARNRQREAEKEARANERDPVTKNTMMEAFKKSLLAKCNKARKKMRGSGTLAVMGRESSQNVVVENETKSAV